MFRNVLVNYIDSKEFIPGGLFISQSTYITQGWMIKSKRTDCIPHWTNRWHESEKKENLQSLRCLPVSCMLNGSGGLSQLVLAHWVISNKRPPRSSRDAINFIKFPGFVGVLDDGAEIAVNCTRFHQHILSTEHLSLISPLLTGHSKQIFNNPEMGIFKLFYRVFTKQSCQTKPSGNDMGVYNISQILTMIFSTLLILTIILFMIFQTVYPVT